jgi:hypothetical protein
MTIIEVTKSLNFSINSTISTLQSVDSKFFFTRNNDKWSPAEQSQHLVLSVKPLLLAFGLPKFALRLLFGKPNRNSRSYDEVYQKYLQKLEAGGTASSPYRPKELKTGTTPQKVIADFEQQHQKFIRKIAMWLDEDLDRYLLPHPLLGKITLREMIYFTDFHILHHQDLITKLYLK